MDIKWEDFMSGQFVTSIGLITSNGPYGQNIESVEWTHHVSYEPGIIVACIRPADATHKNIETTKEFGVNIAAHNQATIVSVSGNYTGKDTDKIKALKELGFKFYKGKKINCMMVEGAALNAECKLQKAITLGDHTMFIGDVIEASANKNIMPFAYHQKKFWKLEKNVEKPSDSEMERIRNTVQMHRKVNGHCSKFHFEHLINILWVKHLA
ncbi:flavin reductase [Candidatus Woesearchaeota archaeon]|nr:flavin reductase [Candidatus Woesearchaeota archaeon]